MTLARESIDLRLGEAHPLCRVVEEAVRLLHEPPIARERLRVLSRGRDQRGPILRRCSVRRERGDERLACIECGAHARLRADAAARVGRIRRLTRARVADGDDLEGALERVRDGLRHLNVDTLSELSATVHHLHRAVVGKDAHCCGHRLVVARNGHIVLDRHHAEPALTPRVRQVEGAHLGAAAGHVPLSLGSLPELRHEPIDASGAQREAKGRRLARLVHIDLADLLGITLRRFGRRLDDELVQRYRLNHAGRSDGRVAHAWREHDRALTSEILVVVAIV